MSLYTLSQPWSSLIGATWRLQRFFFTLGALPKFAEISENKIHGEVLNLSQIKIVFFVQVQKMQMHLPWWSAAYHGTYDVFGGSSASQKPHHQLIQPRPGSSRGACWQLFQPSPSAASNSRGHYVLLHPGHRPCWLLQMCSSIRLVLMLHCGL